VQNRLTPCNDNSREFLAKIEDADFTQKQMGEILNCSQRIYSNYECSDVDIPTSVLIKLAEFHKTSIDYLLELTDEKCPYPRKKNEK